MYIQTIKGLFALMNKKLLIGIIGLHAGGFALGYAVSKLGGAGEKKSQAISIETGKFLKCWISSPSPLIALCCSLTKIYFNA